ncbi:hypothetical protein [Streptomyces sp. NPDC000851]
MSDGQSWLIPLGADGGDFKWEVQFLRSIARPLAESTDVARKIAKQQAEEQFDFAGMTEVAKTGTEEVSQAVDDFLDKWCHGLGCIAEDADVIVSALSATINDFLVTETKVKYDLMMVQRQKQFEEDHPFTSWLEDQGIGGERTQFRGRIDPVDHSQSQGQE